MANLTYFGWKISPNQVQTREDYLLCLNVPICRTGFQEYLGSEIMGHSDYDPAWGIQSDDIVRIYRPLEEVTSDTTRASFEGKTVTDEHPVNSIAPNGLVTVDNDAELNRGHVQNVRVGEVLKETGEPDCDGETPLLADLHIKNLDLIQKVDEQGIREVSCGYTYRLRRREDGVIEQYDILGNHVAVVPKGRAGKAIAIGDAAPPEITDKEACMPDNKKFSLGRLLKRLAATDAEPEELEATVEKFSGAAAHDAEAAAAAEAKKKKEEEEQAAKDRAAKDADPEKEKAQQAFDALWEAKKSGKDSTGKDANIPELVKQLTSFFTEEAGEKEHAGADSVEELKEPEKKEKDESGKDAEGGATVIEAGKAAADEELDETGKAAIKTSLDSAYQVLREMKPVIARIAATPKSKRTAQDQAALDSYNARVKALNEANPYAALVKVKVPEVAAHDAADKTLKSPSEFFAGKTYAEGKAAYDAYLAEQNKEGGK